MSGASPTPVVRSASRPTGTRSSEDLTAPTDADLLSAIACRDERAFEALYERYAAACRVRARQVLRGQDWVHDVVQGVFIDVWLHAGRFDVARGSARSWLMTMTRHKAVDVVRSQERYNKRRTSEDGLRDAVDPAPLPDDAVASAETAARLRQAVAGLSPPQRDALRLCYLAGLTQREAASCLGVPEDTMKTRSWRGVAELRRLLGPKSL